MANEPIYHTWPRLMRAETASAYVDEKDVRSFLRRVGTTYPRGRPVRGRGTVWLKDELDRAIDSLVSERPALDLADDL